MATDAPTPSPDTTATARSDRAVLLFDGVCTLCNGFVNFLIDHDPRARIQVGALQSDEARHYLDAFGLDPHALDSVVLIEKGRVYRKSTAALRVARHLSPPWSFAVVLLAIPRPLRDRIYDVVANYRYEWFGTRDSCRMPTPELKQRFL